MKLAKILVLTLIHGTLLAGVAHGKEVPAMYDHLKETTTIKQTVVGCVEVKGGCLGVTLYTAAKTNTLMAANEKTPVMAKDAGIAWTYKF